MSHINTIFHQVLQLIPRYKFDQQVLLNNGDYYAKQHKCWGQFSTLLYAQASKKDSLRDIETGLKLQREKLYHLGTQNIPRSTLSYLNQHKPAEIYEGLFYDLSQKMYKFARREKRFRFKNPLKALDSSTIDLCLALFPWAKFRTTKGAIKIHNLFDVKDQIPEVIIIEKGNKSDISIAKEMDFSKYLDSIIVMDRGYVDFTWLSELNKQKVFFVTRLKDKVKYLVIGQHKMAIGKGIIKDEIIELTNSKNKYPERLRLVTFYDEETGNTYEFITNIFHLAASTVANIYKARWDIELFFKWIKQNLRIKTFYGTNRNAVMTQIWIAMIYYLLLTYMKHQTKYDYSLLDLTRILEEKLFDRVVFLDLLALKFMSGSKANAPNPYQLSLF